MAKYKYVINMPAVTITSDKKLSKRSLVKQASQILMAETTIDSLYKETEKEFKIKSTKLDV